MMVHSKRDRFFYTLTRGIAIFLWTLIGLCFAVQLPMIVHPSTKHINEPYGLMAGMFLLPVALLFQISVYGWRNETRWSWLARTAPLWLFLPCLKWC